MLNNLSSTWWEQEATLPVQVAKGDFRRTGMWGTWAWTIQTRSQGNGIFQKGRCVGSETSNKFIWVGGTEMKIQRVFRTVLLRVCPIKTNSEILEPYKPFIKSFCYTYYHCDPPVVQKARTPFSFLPVSLNGYMCIPQSKNVSEVTAISGSICLWLVLTLQIWGGAWGECP